MKNIFATMTLLLFPFISFAGAHSELGGHGTGILTDTKVFEGKTGTLVRNMAQDV